MEVEQENAKLNIKWGKQNIEVETSLQSTLEEFRALIYSLTNVLPEKQKLLTAGKLLKDNSTTLSQYKIKNGQKLILMGKPEDKQVNLQMIMDNNKQMFIENMSPEDRAKYLKEVLGENLAIGLVNLGNTCYVNASMQFLGKIKELRTKLENYSAPNNPDLNQQLALEAGNLYKNLDKKGEAFRPNQFLFKMFQAFPQFQEMDPSQKAYKQQDADEYFQLFISSLGPALWQDDKGMNLIQDLLEFQLEAVMKNKEVEDEVSQPTYEKMNKLSCIIDNQMNPVNNLTDGIKIGLEEEVEKYSESLDRNCLWTKSYRIASLPKYLIVQKIRFVWREQDIGTNTEAGKAKILRSVAFPQTLDVFDYCTEELQKQLDPIRKEEIQYNEKLKEKQQEEYEQYKKQHATEEEDTFKIYKKYQQEKNLKEEKQMNEKIWKEFGTGKDTANYQLVSVITHKGRSTNSGHYVAWCQDKGDQWLKFDDDEVTQKRIEDILNLRGGGDWHMAYYLLYRKLQF